MGAPFIVDVTGFETPAAAAMTPAASRAAWCLRHAPRSILKPCSMPLNALSCSANCSSISWRQSSILGGTGAGTSPIACLAICFASSEPGSSEPMSCVFIVVPPCRNLLSRRIGYPAESPTAHHKTPVPLQVLARIVHLVQWNQSPASMPITQSLPAIPPTKNAAQPPAPLPQPVRSGIAAAWQDHPQYTGPATDYAA